MRDKEEPFEDAESKILELEKQLTFLKKDFDSKLFDSEIEIEKQKSEGSFWKNQVLKGYAYIDDIEETLNRYQATYGSD